MKEEEKSCCSHKTKERSEKEYKDLIHRLNRIEGQIRGIKGMVEKNAYCPDILTQVAAANAALNSFNKVLFPLPLFPMMAYFLPCSNWALAWASTGVSE